MVSSCTKLSAGTSLIRAEALAVFMLRMTDEFRDAGGLSYHVCVHVAETTQKLSERGTQRNVSLLDPFGLKLKRW